jgi:hypothetical protein
MDKIDHLMAEKNKNNKGSQKGQVTPKNILTSLINPVLKQDKIKLNFGFATQFG